MSDPLETCAYCGKTWTKDPGEPTSQMSWCSAACSDAWFAARPGEAAKWTAVGDMTTLQRAELDAILGLGAKA